MNFQISPNHSETLPLGDLRPEASIALLLEAAKVLTWHIQDVDPSGFTAYTNFEDDSWAEEVTLK